MNPLVPNTENDHFRSTVAMVYKTTSTVVAFDQLAGGTSEDYFQHTITSIDTLAANHHEVLQSDYTKHAKISSTTSATA